LLSEIFTVFLRMMVASIQMNDLKEKNFKAHILLFQ